ncbi:MAG TPA: DmsE family decaheme c-type cytochrome [Acidobacteriaceae bacterium]|nr:DmsE family decaheme c-type cytochrome [Acidobacteriaceae bacterium]
MKRFLVWAAAILLVPGLAYAAGGSKQTATAKAPVHNAADYVGSETCATCHADVAQKFESNPHSKMALIHGNPQGQTCESCHGPGRAHVESGGDVSKILQLSKAPTKVVDATCLTCHAGAHPNFDRSPHARAGVSCISCHSVHSSTAETKLLKASQPKLCYQCHADQKAQFNMPIHHKVNEGLVKCSDCHDVHGTFLANNLKSTEDQNQVCTKCHTDVRGPFVFEHAPVRAEGCVTCHTPHGSQNPRLLNMPSIATLCNQCHSPLSAGGVHGLDPGSTTVTPCITCHTMIHGSNNSQAFIR